MDNSFYDNPDLIIETSDLEPGSINWRSPSNIALVKYWGKHGKQLPRNPSISITLESAFTQTILEYTTKEESHAEIDLELYFHQERNAEFEKKVKAFLNSLTLIFPFLRQLSLTIHTGNSFPHSTGIASSASSMSALALCLCSLEHELFDTLSDDAEFDRKASFIARLGSGSACRSIFPTMAIWGGTSYIEGSSDYFAISLNEIIHSNFAHIHDDILIVSSEEKKVSSSMGHELMEGNPFAEPRFQQAKKHTAELIEAIRLGDYESFGRITEREALTLHSLMMSSSSAYYLLKPNTLHILDLIRAYREETKLPVYFTLDAGPNVHLLYPENIMHEVRVFVEEQLKPYCENGFYIGDWAGDGPEQI